MTVFVLMSDSLQANSEVQFGNINPLELYVVDMGDALRSKHFLSLFFTTIVVSVTALAGSYSDLPPFFLKFQRYVQEIRQNFGPVQILTTGDESLWFSKIRQKETDWDLDLSTRIVLDGMIIHLVQIKSKTDSQVLRIASIQAQSSKSLSEVEVVEKLMLQANPKAFSIPQLNVEDIKKWIGSATRCQSIL